MSTRGILYVLAKAPAAGLVKTRLIPPLSAAQASRLALAMAGDTLARAAPLRGIEVRLAIDDGAAGADGEGSRLLRGEARRLGIAVEEQGGGDLGQRMGRLIERGTAGAPTLLLGTDAPDLPLQRITDAFTVLERSDAVIVPAADGGYVAIGAARSASLGAARSASLGAARVAPGLFEIDAAWGSERVFAATCASLERAGVSFETLEGWEDVDDAAALGRLASRLEGSGGAEAPATERLLARWRREGVRF